MIGNNEQKNDIKKKVIMLFQTYSHINKLMKWWNEIPNSFAFTAVGKLLAYTFVKTLDQTIPDIYE